VATEITSRCVRLLSVRINGWIVGVVLWIGVIFFSSTSLAAQWCEEGFHFLSTVILGQFGPENPSFGLVHLLADKSVHVSLFLVLAFLLWKVFRGTPRKFILILVAGAVVGSASEFLQRFFPGRDPAVPDVLLNTASTAVGAVICLTWVRYRSRTEEPVLK
jgi:VanZ family protein